MSNVTGTDGQGFSVVVDSARQAAERVTPGRQEGSAMAEPLRKIICIEDEPEIIDLVKLILGRHSYHVIGANGGRAGLEIIRAEKPDLVLLDLMMPDMDGWDVYQQMKAEEETRGIPVIIVTAKAQSIDKVLGLHIAKVDDYIAKPFSPHELVESVDRVLAQQREQTHSED